MSSSINAASRNELTNALDAMSFETVFGPDKMEGEPVRSHLSAHVCVCRKMYRTTQNKSYNYIHHVKKQKTHLNKLCTENENYTA